MPGSGQTLDQFGGGRLRQCGQHRTKFGQDRTRFGRCWANVAELRPHAPITSQVWPNSSRIRSALSGSWSNPRGRIWPAAIWTSPNPVQHSSWPHWLTTPLGAVPGPALAGGMSGKVRSGVRPGVRSGRSVLGFGWASVRRCSRGCRVLGPELVRRTGSGPPTAARSRNNRVAPISDRPPPPLHPADALLASIA